MDLGVDYSIAHVIIKPGDSIEAHMMMNPEAHYILAGEGILYIEDVPFELSKGQLVLVPANSKQYTVNAGEIDLEYFAIDQPAWSQENEEMLE
jgi:mannose-6-phosphate isomerase-like protein (cupin superfamily)